MENTELLKAYVRSGVADYRFRPWKKGLLAVASVLLLVGGGLSVVEAGKSAPNPAASPAADSGERSGVRSLPGDDPTANPPTSAGTSEGGGSPAGAGSGTSGSGASSFIGDLPPGIDIDLPTTVPPGTNPQPDGSPSDAPTDSPTPTPGPDTQTTDGESAAGETGRWSPAFLKTGFGFFVGFCVGFAIRTLLRLALIAVGVNVLVLVVLSSLGWVEVHWSVIGTQFDGWIDSLGPELESIESFLLGRLPTTGLTALGLYTGLRKK